jgi:hypothetical protein
MIRSSLSVVATLSAVMIFKCCFLVEFSSYPTRLAYRWGSGVSTIFHPSPTTQVSAPSSVVDMCTPSVVRYRASRSDGSLYWTSRVDSKRTVCAMKPFRGASSLLPKSCTVLKTFSALSINGESLSGSSSGPVLSESMSEIPPRLRSSQSSSSFCCAKFARRLVAPYCLGMASTPSRLSLGIAPFC